MADLRHTVGKSTLAEGMAVPKSHEAWIDAPQRGEKRLIALLFDGQSVTATLRRLANTREHVQIKYENKGCAPFRDWLTSVFSPDGSGMTGEYLELERLGHDVFRVHAYPVSRQPEKRLSIAEWVFHRTDRQAFRNFTAIREIPAIVQSVEFEPSEGQSFYNRQLSRFFTSWQWQSECRVIPELPLKCDFIKDAVQVEVEFGNARTYYQDYIKFLLAFQQKAASVGVLIVPTEGFAHALCTVGRKRALAKGRSSYSGMIHIEKVKRELPFLSPMLKVPLAIAGIHVHGTAV